MKANRCPTTAIHFSRIQLSDFVKQLTTEGKLHGYDLDNSILPAT